MINTLPETSDGLVCLQFTGKITPEDYDPILTDLQRRLGTRETLDLYVEMKDIEAWEPSAMWKDARFGLKHSDRFRRVAIVGDAKWEKAMTEVMKPFAKGEVRYFPIERATEARDWVRS